MESLIGRAKEIKKLTQLYKSSKSEFLVIYGRRRVGKTFLIREFYDNQFDFHLTGMANAKTSQQLVNFQQAINTQFKLEEKNNLKTYFEAFQVLIKQLNKIKKDRKKIIFLDELPWLDTIRSDFLMALEHFWNTWATTRKDIILIGCGSAASWMIDKLLNHHGGLHNRVTERIKLNPFSLHETEKFLLHKGVVLDRYQIVNLYMVMGGIPYYLDAVKPNLSALQNIDSMCFEEDGVLFQEYKYLFPSLFRNPMKYEIIVSALNSKTTGVTRNDLIKLTNISSGGTLTKKLTELEESGFVKSYIDPDRKSKDTLYRLSDFYCRFYLKFIQGHKSFEAGFWIQSLDHPRQRTWSGYAFEQVCLSHVSQIKKSLGIAGILSKSFVWRSKSSDPAAQIDLVIDRRDQVVNLCEIKYSTSPYSITKAYTENIRNKITVFKQETKTKKAIFFTMITTFGLKPNKYTGALVQNEITMDALFEQN